MGAKFVPTDGLVFDDVKYNKIWDVKVPKFVHDYHGWWDYWEIDRNISMSRYLQPGMLLYDCGTFDGWLAAVYQQWVGGPENIVLIEPVPEMWANTRATWDANGLAMPKATYMGFVANKEHLSPKVNMGTWPEGPDYSQIIKAISFRLMYEESHDRVTACTRLDTIAAYTGDPDAITIDVEGSEYEVILGADGIIRRKKPLIWIAVHDEFMEFRYSTKPMKLYNHLRDLNYEMIPIAADHENHFLFLPKDR